VPLLPYKTAGWDTHSEVKLREIEYPLFSGDPTHFTVRRTYEGPASTYAAAAIDTADTEFSAAKLVWQGPLVDVDAGCVRYERLFATVPAQWVEPESYAYTFPGYAAGAAGSGFAVSSLTESGANIVISAATDIIAGDAVSVSVAYRRNGLSQGATFNGIAIATTNVSQVTVAVTLGGSGVFSSVSGTIAKVQTGAPAARSLVVGSRVVHDYALSSDAALESDLPINPLFTPLDADGEVVDVLTGATTPTATVYRGFVLARSQIVVESVRRRYMGNIFMRQTRYVPAQ
jgi:hypothetical protein